MNCKPGDLAIHIFKGYLVHIVGEGVDHDVIPSISGKVKWLVTSSSEPFWIVEYLGPPHHHVFPNGTSDFFSHGAVYKKNLKPLRDNDKEDETLTWAGKPKEVIHESSTTR